MSAWDGWIGRTQTQSDRLDPALARRWCATFDRDVPDGPIPQGIHLCLCTPEARTAALGSDGHPARSTSGDGFFPPIPLPRRMWAASEIGFIEPLSIGDAVTRTSRIASVSEKEGQSGRLAFVEVDHVTMAGTREAIRETQTLVYRDAAAADAPPSPPEAGPGSFDASGWERVRTVTPGEALLFRYSALTFNTHRIHYDAPYAQREERYRGLVVHGPLIASLLLQLAAEEFGDNALASFAFRAVSPAIAGQALHLALRDGEAGIELGSFAADGRQTLKATATLA